MKKLVYINCLAICAMIHTPVASAQTLVFSNQTIRVDPQNLAVESVEFRPFSIITNSVATWHARELITTNGLFAGGEVVTNIASEQVVESVVSTNTATWTCNVIFSLPPGHLWSLNGMAVTIQTFKTSLQIPVSPVAVQSLLGPAAAGLEFAAQNGAYLPSGQVKDVFLYLAASVLSSGQ
jgi:hypothetical protein